MTQVALISDTHSLLRPEAVLALSDPDYVIHAGDIGSYDILAQLNQVAPVTAIRGNIDKANWASDYSDEEVLKVARRSIYVIHNLYDSDLDPVAAGFDVVMSGHSHKPNIEEINGVLYISPGSAGPQRFSRQIAVALPTIANEGLQARFIELAA